MQNLYSSHGFVLLLIKNSVSNSFGKKGLDLNKYGTVGRYFGRVIYSGALSGCYNSFFIDGVKSSVENVKTIYDPA